MLPNSEGKEPTKQISAEDEDPDFDQKLKAPVNPKRSYLNYQNITKNSDSFLMFLGVLYC